MNVNAILGVKYGYKPFPRNPASMKRVCEAIGKSIIDLGGFSGTPTCSIHSSRGYRSSYEIKSQKYGLICTIHDDGECIWACERKCRFKWIRRDVHFDNPDFDPQVFIAEVLCDINGWIEADKRGKMEY